MIGGGGLPGEANSCLKHICPLAVQDKTILLRNMPSTSFAAPHSHDPPDGILVCLAPDDAVRRLHQLSSEPPPGYASPLCEFSQAPHEDASTPYDCSQASPPYSPPGDASPPCEFSQELHEHASTPCDFSQAAQPEHASSPCEYSQASP
eukprot:CAMPEP_0177671950 /NCGR_PEP_ID=MMETSP0447-20121125/25033_1 /TAXON_ID=0 /ORGANISM="Stygamoeba regulata, Strain BSH-02190019" /LENGTH=148 /DNA_ID=CAMNT_0019179489 /DNA_START=592 /DNA_END=1035 /DNA_ORIENTATION=-